MKISKMVLIFCLLILSATLVSCSNTESTWQNSSSDNSSDSISQSKSTTSEYTTVNTTVDTVKSVTEATTVTTAATSKTALQSTSAPHTDDVQIIASGSCGDTGSDVKWTLDHDGCLRIYGKGNIKSDSFNGEKTVSEISSGFIERYKDMKLKYAVEKLLVENGISSIGANSFKGLGKLSAVSIPESISAIGSYAFKETQWLENQQKKDPLVIINNIVIDAEKCSGSLTIPRNVKTISDQAFSLNNNIVSITFSNGITHIGSHMWCSNLQKISIPTSVTGSFGFSYCDKLTTIMIAEGVKNIGDFAFVECKALKSITIPKSVIQIGSNALGYQGAGTEKWWTVEGFTIKGYAGSAAEKYAKANGISFVDLEKKETAPTVKIIASGNCGTGQLYYEPEYGSYNIKYSDNVKWKYDSAGVLTVFGKGNMHMMWGQYVCPWEMYYPSIKKVIIQSGVENIGGRAFSSCKNLSSVSIPNTVKEIGIDAFSNCSILKEIAIPSSVNTIKYEAFYQCDSLKSITIPKTVTKIEEYAFGYKYYDYYEAQNNIKVSGFTIKGYTGSAAEKYAQNNGFKFISLG